MTYRWVIGVTTLLAGAGVAAATATGAFDQPQAVPQYSGYQASRIASPTAGIARAAADQVSAFPAFGRAPSESDRGATDPRLLRGLARAQQQFEVNPSLGRNVYTSTDTQLYLFPGRGVVCFGVISSETGTTVGCNATSAAAQQGLGCQIMVGGTSIVQGVLPAGAHDVVITDTAGHETTLELTADGAYVARLNAPATTLRYVDRTGTSHSQELHY